MSSLWTSKSHLFIELVQFVIEIYKRISSFGIRMYDVVSSSLFLLFIDWIFAARSRMHSATGDKSQEQNTGTGTGTASSDTVTENKIKPRSR